MKVCYTAGPVKKLENCFSVSTNAVEIRIWFLTDDILRIRAGFDGDWDEASYSLTMTAWDSRTDELMKDCRKRVQTAAAELTDGDKQAVIQGSRLKVVVEKAPFRIMVYDKDGSLLHADIPDLAYREDSNHRRMHASQIEADDCFYGFGEKSGVTMDIEFKGGAMVTVGYQGDVDLNNVKQTVAAELGQSNLTVQTGTDVSGAQTLTINLPGSETLSTEQLDSMIETLNTTYPDNQFVQQEVSNVNPTIGNEFLAKSVVAVVAACVLILLYVAVRFRRIGGWSAGAMAIVALLHDMFVVYGVFVLLRIPLNGNFIAAMLTILGYSINDTVVIYDRIRENTGLYGKKMSLPELVNLSINQSFGRSMMTSITTCIALAIVCVVSIIFKLDSIFTFAVPLLFGMVSGVYSTMCIATQLWVSYKTRKAAPAPKKA